MRKKFAKLFGGKSSSQKTDDFKSSTQTSTTELLLEAAMEDEELFQNERQHEDKKESKIPAPHKKHLNPLYTELLKVESDPSITTLTLTGMKITPSRAKYLAAFLKQNKTLQTLKLSKCEIEDKALKFLALGLQKNKTLHSIDFSQNIIKSDGIQYLAIALQNRNKNSKIISLNLAGNTILDKDIEYIQNIIMHNTTLKSLNLSGCGITDAIFAQISFALKNHPSLTEFKCMVNPITDASSGAISMILKENHILTSFKLIGIEFSFNIEMELCNTRALCNVSLLSPLFNFSDRDIYLEHNRIMHQFISNPDNKFKIKIKDFKKWAFNQYHLHFLYYTGVCDTSKNGFTQGGELLNTFPPEILTLIFAQCSYNIHSDTAAPVRIVMDRVMQNAVQQRESAMGV